MAASFALIDGTGQVSDADYDNEMKYGVDNTNFRCINSVSFINRINNNIQSGIFLRPGKIISKYHRGPGQSLAIQWGQTCASILSEMTSWFDQNYDQFKTGPIYIAGYSRGGFVAIEYAKYVQARGLKVDGLFLFDAVQMDSTIAAQKISSNTFMKYASVALPLLNAVNVVLPAVSFFSSTPVPANVKVAYHAYRDTAIGSRPIFINCGMTGPVQLQKYPATHAAMGGVPWTGDHPVKYVERPSFMGNKASPLALGMNSSSPATMPVAVPTITEQEDFAQSNNVWSWMNFNISKELMTCRS